MACHSGQVGWLFVRYVVRLTCELLTSHIAWRFSAKIQKCCGCKHPVTSISVGFQCNSIVTVVWLISSVMWPDSTLWWLLDSSPRFHCDCVLAFHVRVAWFSSNGGLIPIWYGLIPIWYGLIPIKWCLILIWRWSDSNMVMTWFQYNNSGLIPKWWWLGSMMMVAWHWLDDGLSPDSVL